MNKEKIKGFIAGICTATTFAGVATAFAITADIRTDNFRIFWGGIEQTLRTESGSEITPIMYNDSVYVPVRAVANLVGISNKDIDYNANTDDGYFEVYINGKPIEDSIWIEDLKAEKINFKSVDILTGKYANFKLKDETINCQNLMKANYFNFRDIDEPETSRSNSNIFVIDGKYSELQGKVVMPYTIIGSDAEGKLCFYSVADDGNKMLLKEYELKQTEKPVDVSVNLNGITNLMIQWAGERVGNSGEVALYDVKLIGKEN